VQTGERSGRLDEVLNRLADFLEEERKLRDRLITAMIYPVIILVLSLAVGMAMLFFMLPSFQNLLMETGIEMPWITRAVMAGARVAAWVVPGGLILLVLGIGWARARWRTDEEFRITADRRLHRLPVYRSFYSVLANIRFTRTLSMLIPMSNSFRYIVLPTPAFGHPSQEGKWGNIPSSGGVRSPQENGGWVDYVPINISEWY
jgi:type II secretory pathway component PulF